VQSDRPLSSVEAFALALVEASSRLTADEVSPADRERHEAGTTAADTTGAE
jgi:hypothetical protein